MVGSPKNLSDLYRIEAQVRVTCRGCQATEVWELDALIAEVRKNGGNTVSVRLGACGSFGRLALSCSRR